MSNEIIGKSKEHNEAKRLENEGKQLQTLLNKNFQKQLKGHEKRLTNLEDTMRVNGVQEMNLTNKVNRVVVGYLGGKKSEAYQDNSLRARVYASINREIKKKFGIPRRAELPAKDYNDCITFIENWLLDKELKDEIEAMNNQLQLA